MTTVPLIKAAVTKAAANGIKLVYENDEVRDTILAIDEQNGNNEYTGKDAFKLIEHVIVARTQPTRKELETPTIPAAPAKAKRTSSGKKPVTAEDQAAKEAKAKAKEQRAAQRAVDKAKREEAKAKKAEGREEAKKARDAARQARLEAGDEGRTVVRLKYKAKYEANDGLCGDGISLALRDAIRDDEGDVVQQYLFDIGHANNIDVLERWGARNFGQQRMNLGNCLRGLLSQGKEVHIGNQVFKPTAEQLAKVQERETKKADRAAKRSEAAKAEKTAEAKATPAKTAKAEKVSGKTKKEILNEMKTAKMAKRTAKTKKAEQTATV